MIPAVAFVDGDLPLRGDRDEYLRLGREWPARVARLITEGPLVRGLAGEGPQLTLLLNSGASCQLLTGARLMEPRVPRALLEAAMQHGYPPLCPC